MENNSPAPRRSEAPRDWLLKKGVVRMISPQVSADVPPAASVFAASLLTLMVLSAGALTWYILPLAPWSVKVRLLFLGVNAGLWLLTGYVWFRALAEQRQGRLGAPTGEAGSEQGEGVWPPAPQAPKNRKEP